MSDKRRHIRVGVFVVVGTALLAGAIFALGLARAFRETITAETYVDESVQGLNEGSPVRFRGVEIGSVSTITFLTSEYPRPPDDEQLQLAARLVLVRFELESEKLAGALISDVDAIRSMVDRGLRIKLASTGLTGIAYLEMSYSDAEEEPPLDIWWRPRSVYIPAARSTFTRLTDSAQGIVSDLEDAELALLVRDAGTLLTTGTGLVNDLRALVSEVQGAVAGQDLARGVRDGIDAIAELRSASAELRQLLASVNQTLTPDDLRAVMANVQETLHALRTASGSIATLTTGLTEALPPETLDRIVADAAGSVAAVRAGAERLPGTIRAANQALRRLGDVVATTQTDLDRILDDLSGIAANLRQLAASARAYPSQIPFGSPPPRIQYEDR